MQLFGVQLRRPTYDGITQSVIVAVVTLAILGFVTRFAGDAPTHADAAVLFASFLWCGLAVDLGFPMSTGWRYIVVVLGGGVAVNAVGYVLLAVV